MRGNVETHMGKLGKGGCDTIVLAAAGLIRLGLEKKVTQFLSPDVMLPAVGQGAVAVRSPGRRCRGSGPGCKAKIVGRRRRAIEAERGFTRGLGANCRTPTAAYTRFADGTLTIEGMVTTASGKLVLRGRISSDNPNAERTGRELAESLLKKGAGIVLEAA